MGEHDALGNLEVADCSSYYRYCKPTLTFQKRHADPILITSKFTGKIEVTELKLRYILQAKLDKCTMF